MWIGGIPFKEKSLMLLAMPMYYHKGVKISWLGHDGFRIQNGETIYIDPFQIAGSPPKGDLVLISHEHFDHCSPDDLKKVVGPGTVIIAHHQSHGELSKLKAKDVKIMKPGDKLKVGKVEVEAVPAYNTNKFREPGKVFHPKEDGKLGFILTVNGVRIYHAGDTDHIPEMNDTHPEIALLPISGTYVMTAQEAAEAVASIKPKVVIPMHFGAIVGELKDAEVFKKLVACQVEILAKEG